MALTPREARTMKEQARRAIGILSANQPVTRQDCFGNEGPKKLRDLQKRFLNNLAEAGVVDKSESEGPNMPSTYRLKNAKALVRVHDDDLTLVNMIWPQPDATAELEKFEQLGLLPAVEVPAPVVIPPPAPVVPPTGPATFVPPEIPEFTMKDLDTAVANLMKIGIGVTNLLVSMKAVLNHQAAQIERMEKRVNELHEMWSSK